MTPEEEGSDVREMVWEMSRTTNRILIFGIILILAILAALIYLGIITFPHLISNSTGENVQRFSFGQKLFRCISHY